MGEQYVLGHAPGPATVPARPAYELTKRLLDVGLATAVLVACAPLAGYVAVRIKLEDGGPILYRAQRVGRGGRPFAMLKFRSMVLDADRLGSSSTADDDPRLTQVGRRLRRYKLDELPQFVNVLCGHMSLVGPRPQVAWDVARYTQRERRLLDVRPGITDWASVRFRNEGEILAGHADIDKAYDEFIRPEKIELGLAYVRRRSFAVDLRILWLTALAVMRPAAVDAKLASAVLADRGGATPADRPAGERP